MSYSTPSERLSSSARRFFGLRPLDGLRLSRTIWTVTLIVYACQFLLSAVSILSYVVSTRPLMSDFWLAASLVGPLLSRFVEPLLWLLIIRLVLEVCMRLLAQAGPPLTDDDGM